MIPTLVTSNKVFLAFSEYLNFINQSIDNFNNFVFFQFQGCQTFGGSHVSSPSWPVCFWTCKYVQKLLRIGPGLQYFDQPAGGWVTFMPR